jgi:hypothetical protein
MPEHETASPVRLREVVVEFHRNLRWARYDHAVAVVHTSYKERFRGRYEELGEDYHIIDLRIRKVDIQDEQATVEVEQKWYREPNMTVRKDRFVELWEPTRDSWEMHDRITKDEWLARNEEKKQEREEENGDEQDDPRTDGTHGSR